MCENSDFAMKINEINVELSGRSQRYMNECCESESDGKIDGFGAGCCKRRGGVAVAIWCYSSCWHIGYAVLKDVFSTAVDFYSEDMSMSSFICRLYAPFANW
jgi:hypothetical protein